MFLSRLPLLSLLVLLSLSLPAHAALFLDVPDGHEFQVPIESLAGSGVIKGNPDGTYSPDNRVNRAEMLTMLYRATKKLPDSTSRSCFSDVETGAWYESVVCDGAAKKYVSGYPDGLFRPADSVSRVEALKMIHTVFSLQINGDMTPLHSIPSFADVPMSAWFSGFVANAHAIGILPISGSNGSSFRPELPLTRKEAAAYIHNTFHALNRLEAQARIAAIPTPTPIEEKRRSDVNAILNAVYQYAIDHNGKYPKSIPIGTSKEICATSGAECGDLVDLSVVLNGGGRNSLARIPSDDVSPRTGYSIRLDGNKRVTISSMHAPKDSPIEVLR